VIEAVSVAKAFITLFIITSPIGTVPLYLPMTAQDPPARRRRTALMAAATCGAVLGIAAVAGEALFGIFGISLDAFRIAGAVILFAYGIELLQMRQPRARTTDQEVQGGVDQAEVGIVPLGMPMLAGPGAIATVMVLRGSHHPAEIAVAVALLAIVTAIILLSAVRLERFLTPVALGIVVRVEALLLTAIAVQMLVDALRGLGALPSSITLPIP
jgi:multiple antibiotic resistance protein